MHTCMQNIAKNEKTSKEYVVPSALSLWGLGLGLTNQLTTAFLVFEQLQTCNKDC